MNGGSRNYSAFSLEHLGISVVLVTICTTYSLFLSLFLLSLLCSYSRCLAFVGGLQVLALELCTEIKEKVKGQQHNIVLMRRMGTENKRQRTE